MTGELHAIFDFSIAIAFLSIPITLLVFWKKVNKINKLLMDEIKNHQKTTRRLEYWTSIIKSSNDAIIGVTMKGNISSWNLGAEDVFGYSSAEIIGESYYKLLPHAQIEEMKRMFMKTKEGKRLVHRELNHMGKNGLVINGLLTISPVKIDDDEVIGISVIIRDITSRKKIEEEMNRLTQIKTVSEIAASISHEVRNPLTVTRGFTQLLRDSNLSEEQKNQYINLSLDELDRAERIICDYLTFAKPTMEDIEIINLNQEVKYIVQVINPYATLNNITVEVMMEEMEFNIFGEKQKLHQSLLNIIKNGVEAMENNGKITVQLKQANENALLIISDTGKGMSEEQIKKLGTPYYSTKEKGTGLGTMVTFSIIRAMQGEYIIESQIGEGTSFYIFFPLVEIMTIKSEVKSK